MRQPRADFEWTETHACSTEGRQNVGEMGPDKTAGMDATIGTEYHFPLIITHVKNYSVKLSYFRAFYISYI